MKQGKAKYGYLFIAANIVYLFFVIRGLPNHHYLDWTREFQIGDCIAIIIFTIPLVCLVLKWLSRKQDYVKDSIWFAFFTSVPFLIYDSLYLGIFKGFGFSYFREFWFLTIFYFIVWVEMPLIGYLMQVDDPKITKKHLLMLLIAVVAWWLNWWEGSYSHHYLDLALNMKLAHLINIVLMLLPIIYLVLKFHSSKAQYFKDAIFLTLYLMFIFVLFDFFYFAISQDHGLRYLVDYWFVTVLYVIFWIEIPLVGRVMQKDI
ncbi:MAG: hypothetical protein OES20_12830 [Gammaproteobacteria bacterium]|nr:hypothetical protein [Gammaproteobacteria bacterium]MDH3858362.1 hypothetical protein [Gammaproteobacteria bacterium]